MIFWHECSAPCAKPSHEKLYFNKSGFCASVIEKKKNHYDLRIKSIYSVILPANAKAKIPIEA
jgi:hypothetical protein